MLCSSVPARVSVLHTTLALMTAALLAIGCSLPQIRQPVRPWSEVSSNHMNQRSADFRAQAVKCSAHAALGGSPSEPAGLSTNLIHCLG